jgi:hypothetical protein
MLGRRKKKMDRKYPFLPTPEVFPPEPADPPREGWWNDPFEQTMVAQRYHDGMRWTQYVCVRTARQWTEVFEESPPPSS